MPAASRAGAASTAGESDRARRYAASVQPPGLWTRCVEAGWAASLASERVGRATSSPPQFGHVPPSTVVAQSTQNVHSNEQMRAPAACAGRSLSQHSQFGFICSMGVSKTGVRAEKCNLTPVFQARTAAAAGHPALRAASRSSETPLSGIVPGRHVGSRNARRTESLWGCT